MYHRRSLWNEFRMYLSFVALGWHLRLVPPDEKQYMLALLHYLREVEDITEEELRHRPRVAEWVRQRRERRGE